jgi:hypothetical protein
MELISAHNFCTNKNVFLQEAAWSMDHYRIFQKKKSLTRINISLCIFYQVYVCDTTLVYNLEYNYFYDVPEVRQLIASISM